MTTIPCIPLLSMHFFVAFLVSVYVDANLDACSSLHNIPYRQQPGRKGYSVVRKAACRIHAVAATCKGLTWNGSLTMCATKCRLDGSVQLLQISRRELENIQQGKGKITRLHTKLSRLTQVGSQYAIPLTQWISTSNCIEVSSHVSCISGNRGASSVQQTVSLSYSRD